jgi:TonB family protein
MIAAAVALVLWAFGAPQTGAAAGPPDLLAARALYAAGNYEDALTRLATVPSDSSIGEVDEYRALCLLALGRAADAQRSLDDLVTHEPLFRMSETDMSPRLVTMFRETRRRLLPGAARDLYTKARADYDGQRYGAASAEFKTLLALLADEDLATSASTLGDLKVLAEGFSSLADGKVAAAAPPPAPAPAAATPAAASAPSGTSKTSAPDPKRIYSEDDKNVEPPVAIAMPYPSWRPPNAAANREYRGAIRIVIGANGHVESAAMVTSVTAAYDAQLLAAARDWTFKPAQLDGANVRYQKQVIVSLSPR